VSQLTLQLSTLPRRQPTRSTRRQEDRVHRPHVARDRREGRTPPPGLGPLGWFRGSHLSAPAVHGYDVDTLACHQAYLACHASALACEASAHVVHMVAWASVSCRGWPSVGRLTSPACGLGRCGPVIWADRLLSRHERGAQSPRYPACWLATVYLVCCLRHPLVASLLCMPQHAACVVVYCGRMLGLCRAAC
jgi:hypothetical protein